MPDRESGVFTQKALVSSTEGQHIQAGTSPQNHISHVNDLVYILCQLHSALSHPSIHPESRHRLRFNVVNQTHSSHICNIVSRLRNHRYNSPLPRRLANDEGLSSIQDPYDEFVNTASTTPRRPSSFSSALFSSPSPPIPTKLPVTPTHPVKHLATQDIPTESFCTRRLCTRWPSFVVEHRQR